MEIAGTFCVVLCVLYISDTCSHHANYMSRAIIRLSAAERKSQITPLKIETQKCDMCLFILRCFSPQLSHSLIYLQSVHLHHRECTSVLFGKIVSKPALKITSNHSRK